MCGIAGWVSYKRDLTTSRDSLWAMTQTMARRGPDAGGVWLDRHAGLGHRRLSVIDLEGGAQPMLAEQGGRTEACLVYSGEVYNFVELRDELKQLGHRFKTRSDTEVVLRGYLQWGDGVAERLNGMFAFAIWDARSEELFLIRDRMGVKPLFFTPLPDGVLFGSEPKAILAHPEAERRVTAEGLREIMLLVKNPEKTIYAGMSEVRPGQVVRISKNGISKRQYWSLTSREHRDDLSKTVRTVRELLDDIIARQTVADVPLCTLLSGGLDSSTVTALADRVVRAEKGNAVRSFSVDFADHGAAFVETAFNPTSDTPYVRDFVKFTGCNHSEIVLDSASLGAPELTRTVLQATDFPCSIMGDIFASLYRLFEAIRAESTVALSGESADEVFGGYAWFHDPKAVNAGTFPWLASTIGAMTDGRSVLGAEVLERLDLPHFEAESYAQAIEDVPTLRGENPVERRMREICHMHLTRFVQFLLDRKDRMSMAVGLEVRVPFCDHRLVEYVFNAPWHMKTFDGREKSLLREAARSVLPPSILERIKTPYPSTQDPAYEKALRRNVTEILHDRSHPASGLFDRAAVEELLARPLGETSTIFERAGLERVASLGSWIKDQRVTIDL